MNEKNYLKVIEILGEKIGRMETDLFLKDYEISNLKTSLKEAEATIESLKKGDGK